VVDTTHSFGVFYYWGRDRAHRKGKAHVAVLIVESAAGRYRPALQALAEYVPLIVIELRARVVDKQLQLTPSAVIANSNLDITVVPAADELADRTEEDWKSETDDGAWAAYEALLEFVNGLGRMRPEYRQRTYVSLRRGRRSWAVVSFSSRRRSSSISRTRTASSAGGRPLTHLKSSRRKRRLRECPSCGRRD
jgi:hypothetical protein